MASINGDGIIPLLHLSYVRECSGFAVARSSGPVGFKEQQCSPGNVQVYVDAVFGRDPQEVRLAGARKEVVISNKARKQITSF